MSTFTVFNIGTGHKRGEVNNTVADLYRRCRGSLKFINDGPGTSRLVCVHASPKFITEWLE